MPTNGHVMGVHSIGYVMGVPSNGCVMGVPSIGCVMGVPSIGCVMGVMERIHYSPSLSFSPLTSADRDRLQ